MKIRILRDFQFFWQILVDGVAVDMSTVDNLALTVKFATSNWQFTPSFNIIDGNLIVEGTKEQFCQIGKYYIVATWRVADADFSDGYQDFASDVNIVEIVGRSDYEDFTDNTITSTVAIGLRGLNAFEFWQLTNPGGTIEEYYAYLQAPATEAADSVALLEQAVEDAEELRVIAENAREENTATTITNCEEATTAATEATDDANDAAILANEKAGLANDAALLANEKATLANDAAILANEKAGLANDAASLASTKAGLANNAALLANEKAGLAATATTQANTARDGANTAAAFANSALSIAPHIFEGYANLPAGVETLIPGTSFTPVLNLRPVNIQVFYDGMMKDVSGRYVVNGDNYDVYLTSPVDLFGAEITVLGSLSNPFAQFQPSFEKMYYWYDNATYGNVRRIKFALPWADGLNCTQYEVKKNSDASYEIYDIQKATLCHKKLGEIKPTSLVYLDYALNSKIERVSFQGTSIKYRVNKNVSHGIFRAALIDGDFRGTIYTGMQAAVNTDKQVGYYYAVMQAGNYTTLDASLSGLQLKDIIQWDGIAWQKYTQEQYTYVDIDCYSATPTLDYVTLFENLALGDYRLGLFAINEKNPASSGYTCYPGVSTNILTRAFSVYGGVPNSCENPISITNVNTSHWQMSTRIRKNETAQTYQWIPAHSGNNTLVNIGSDMQNWVNDSELVGFNVGDVEFVEISNYRMVSDMYAINTAAPSEYLMKVTTELNIDVTGAKWDIRYETLIETEIGDAYSYMFPWDNAVHNKFVTDKREQLTLPTDEVKVNIIDGAGRKAMLTYNDTVGGVYENIVTVMNIYNVAETNKGSLIASQLYRYGATYGKLYTTARQGVILPVGDVWQTSFKISVGYISGLISKVASYIP